MVQSSLAHASKQTNKVVKCDYLDESAFEFEFDFEFNSLAMGELLGI